MNLQEFRKAYPDYDEVPDAKLVDSLHKKYYSSMPIEEFSEKIGYEPPAPSGMGAILEPTEQKPESVLDKVGKSTSEGIVSLSERKIPESIKAGIESVFPVTKAIPLLQQALTGSEVEKVVKSGGYDLAETYARAGRTLGLDTSDTLKRIEEGRKKWEPAKGDEIKESVVQGTRSTIQSLGAGIPGAAISGVIGGRTGAVAGYAGGAATIFALAEYDRFLEEAEKAGIPKEQVKDEAVLSAIAEGAFEGLSDIIGAKIFGLTKAVKEPVKQGFIRAARGFLGKMAKLGAAEIPSEMATSATQAQLREQAGLPTESPWESAKGAIGSSTVQTLLMGPLAGGVQAARPGQAKQQPPPLDLNTVKQAYQSKQINANDIQTLIDNYPDLATDLNDIIQSELPTAVTTALASGPGTPERTEAVSNIVEALTRSGGEVEQVSGPKYIPFSQRKPETANFPSMEVEATETPDMGPTNLEQLRGMLYGKDVRVTETIPKEPVKEERQARQQDIEDQIFDAWRVKAENEQYTDEDLRKAAKIASKEQEDREFKQWEQRAREAVYTEGKETSLQDALVSTTEEQKVAPVEEKVEQPVQEPEQPTVPEQPLPERTTGEEGATEEYKSKTPSETFRELDEMIAKRGKLLDAKPLGTTFTIPKGKGLGSMVGTWKLVDVAGDKFYKNEKGDHKTGREFALAWDDVEETLVEPSPPKAEQPTVQNVGKEGRLPTELNQPKMATTAAKPVQKTTQEPPQYVEKQPTAPAEKPPAKPERKVYDQNSLNWAAQAAATLDPDNSGLLLQVFIDGVEKGYRGNDLSSYASQMYYSKKRGHAPDKLSKYGIFKDSTKELSNDVIKALEAPAEKVTPGRAWIKDAWRPFFTYKEFSRGKNKGKVQITTPQGQKVIIEKDQVKEWPKGEPIGEKPTVKEAERKVKKPIEEKVEVQAIKIGDVITDNLIRGKVLSEITIGKDIPAYKVLALSGPEKGKVSAIIKDQAKPVEQPTEEKIEETVKGELRVSFENAAGYPTTVRVYQSKYADLSDKFKETVERELRYAQGTYPNTRIKGDYEFWDGVKHKGKKVTIFERTDENGEKSEHLSQSTPEEEFKRWLREDIANPKYNDTAKALKDRLATEKEAEEKAETEKVEKEQAETAKIREDWNAYTKELEKIKLPTGKKTTIKAKTEKGETFDLEGTQYGNFHVSKSTTQGSRRYGGDVTTYNITHIPTGGLVGKVNSLNDAKLFLKAIIHSKARVDFKNIKDLSKEELALWKDVANSIDALKSPKYFEPPPAAEGKEGEVEDISEQRGITVNTDELSQDVLSKMNKTLRLLGYDIRGADDVKMMLKRHDGLLVNPDWEMAYEKAVKGETAQTEVTERGKKWASAAKKYFGITYNPKEAGYILQDGAMLDLSGKKQGGPSNTRALDHREIGIAIEEELGDESATMHQFMVESGAVRVSFFGDDVIVEFAQIPNNSQLKILGRMLKEGNGNATIDVTNYRGGVLSSTEIERATPQKIKSFIEKAYSGEIEEISGELTRKAFPDNAPNITKSLGRKTTRTFPSHPSASAITAHLAPVLKKLPGMPPVYVMETWDTLPKGVKDFYKQKMVEGDYAAIYVRYNNGKDAVFVLADKQASLNTALGSLWHEMGHKSLRQTLISESPEYNKFLDGLYNSKFKEEINRIAKGYKYDVNTDRGRRRATDEFWAFECSKEGFARGDAFLTRMFDRFVAIVNKLLRSVGIKRPMGRAELKVMMRRAYREMEKPTVSGKGKQVAEVSPEAAQGQAMFQKVDLSILRKESLNDEEAGKKASPGWEDFLSSSRGRWNKLLEDYRQGMQRLAGPGMERRVGEEGARLRERAWRTVRVVPEEARNSAFEHAYREFADRGIELIPVRGSFFGAMLDSDNRIAFISTNRQKWGNTAELALHEFFHNDVDLNKQEAIDLIESVEIGSKDYNAYVQRLLNENPLTLEEMSDNAKLELGYSKPTDQLTEEESNNVFSLMESQIAEEMAADYVAGRLPDSIFRKPEEANKVLAKWESSRVRYSNQKVLPSDVNTPIVHLPNKGREGGFKKLPGVYLRWGEPPKEGASKNWLTMKNEKGVSVIAAWKDPVTGKYVLQEGGEDLINTIETYTFNATEKPENLSEFDRNVNRRKLYEVQGEETNEVGGDEEPLLKNARVVKEVSLDDVVTSSDPWLTLAGTELTDKETPDWSNVDETVADISGEKLSPLQEVLAKLNADHQSGKAQESTGSKGKRILAARQVESNPTNEKAIKEAFGPTNNLQQLIKQFTKPDGTIDVDRFYEQTGITVHAKSVRDLNKAIKWIQTTQDLAHNYPDVQKALSVWQNWKGGANQMNIEYSDMGKDYFKVSKRNFQKVDDALIAGDRISRNISNEQLEKDYGLDEEGRKGYWSGRKVMDDIKDKMVGRFVGDVIGIKRSNELVKKNDLGSFVYLESIIVKAINKRNDKIARKWTDKANREEADKTLTSRLVELGLEKEEITPITTENGISDWSLNNRGYVPHKWKENWRVYAKDRDGIKYVFDVPTKAGNYLPTHELRKSAAEKAAEKVLKKELGINIDPTTIQLFEAKKLPIELFEGANEAVMRSIIESASERYQKELSERMGKEKTDDLKDFSKHVSDVMHEMRLAKGWGAHLLGRNNVQGYRQDDLHEVMAEYIVQFTGWYNKGIASRKFAEVMEGVDPQATPQLWKYLKEYVSDMLAESSEAIHFKRIVSGYFLMADISAAALNMSQNWTHAVGMLRSIKGKGIAEKDLMKAVMDVGKSWVEAKAKGTKLFTEGGKYITQEEANALRTAFEQGMLDPQYFGEVTGLQTNKIYHSFLTDVQRFLYIGFTASEGMNRMSTFLASYRRAKDAGLKDPIAEAVRVTNTSHFIYGKGTRPELIRKLDRVGPGIGSAAYTFMTYPMQNIAFLKNRIEDIAFSKGEDRKTAIKVLASNLAYLGAFGGLNALPFMFLFKTLYRWFTDPEDDWEKWIREHTPQSVGRGITRGIPSIVGNDLSWRVEGTDILGAPIGFQTAKTISRRVENMWKEIKRGEEAHALFMALPDMVRNPYLALSETMAGSGIEGRPPIKYEPTEKVWKAMGFTPTRESEERAVQDIAKRKREGRLEKLEEFAEKYIRAKKKNDQGAISELRNDVKEYNENERSKGRSGLTMKWSDIISSAKKREKTREKQYRERLPKYMKPYQEEVGRSFQ